MQNRFRRAVQGAMWVASLLSFSSGTSASLPPRPAASPQSDVAARAASSLFELPFIDASGFESAGGVSGGACVGDPLLSQSTNDVVVTANSTPACAAGVPPATTDQGLARGFVAAETTTLTCVHFGIEANSGPAFPVKARVYLGSPTDPFESLTLVAESTSYLAPANSGPQLATVDFPGGVALSAGTSFTVELHTNTRVPSEGGDGGAIVLGSNGLGQSAPSYVRANSCAMTNFTNLAALGFPNAHVIMTLYATNPTNTGACCINDPVCGPSCIITSASTCASLSGVYNGNGTECPTSCPNTSIPAGPCETPSLDLASYWAFEGTQVNPARDFASTHDGTLVPGGVGGPFAVPGLHGDALRFDGTNLVTVPIGPSEPLDVQGNGFAFAAWVLIDADTGTYGIASTMGQSFVAPGFHFYVSATGPFSTCATLGFYMDDGIATYVDVSTLLPNIPVGTWTHVGVNVNPSNHPSFPSRCTLFINGQPNAFADPVGGGSVSLQLPGAGMEIGGYFKGMIDSLCFYDAVLNPGVFTAINNAGTAGFCTESCHATWEAPCNAAGVFTPAELQVCNFTGKTRIYNASLSLIPSPTGICTVTPLGAAISPAVPISLTSPSCFIYSLMINCPASATAGDHGCFQASILATDSNSANPHLLTCDGSTIAQGSFKMAPHGGSGLLPDMAVGDTMDVAFDITNTDDVSGICDYTLVAMSSAGGDMFGSAISLGGLPAGTAVAGKAIVPIGQTITVTIPVTAVASHPFVWYDVLIETDADGNGTSEPTCAQYFKISGEKRWPHLNGTWDLAYGDPRAVQNVGTLFGDSTLGDVAYANGSELDAGYGVIDENYVWILLAGNLESNFNKLELFIDYKTGGQNRLRGDNPDVDFNGLNRMGDDGSGNGLRFENSFAADYYVTTTCGGDPFATYANTAQLLGSGGGSGQYLGTGGAGASAPLIGTNGTLVAYDNSNVAGVPGGGGPGSGAGVLSGVEIAVPLALLSGYAGGDIKVCAFINGQNHDYVSNQIIGGTGQDGDINLGDPRAVNFAAISGLQYFVIPGAVPPCVGDYDGSGAVDGGDLASLLGAWGTPDGDLNGDGTTDGPDLALLLGGWGGC